MRGAIAILLFFSLAFQCFVKLGVVIWFNYNQTYIAKNLCENRDKPQMKCCGKCYLKKKLNKVGDEQGRTGSVPMKWDKSSLPVFIIPSVLTFNNSFLNNILVHSSGYSPAVISLPHPAIFHPPITLA